MNKLVKRSRKEQVVLYEELIELQTFLWKHLKYCKDRRRRLNRGKYGDSEREGIDWFENADHFSRKNNDISVIHSDPTLLQSLLSFMTGDAEMNKMKC